MFDVQLFCQTVLHFASCIAGAVSTVTVALCLGDFHGSCILFGSWKKKDSHIETSYGSRANCNFTLATHGIFSLILPFLIGCYFAYAVKRSYHDKDIAYNMWVMPFFFFACVVTFLVFIASCIISAGFASWCHSYVKISGHRCSNLKTGKWMDTPIKDKAIYQQLQVLQVTSWVCLLLWIAQTGLCIMRIIRNRRRVSRETDEDSDRANIGRINPSS